MLFVINNIEISRLTSVKLWKGDRPSKHSLGFKVALVSPVIKKTSIDRNCLNNVSRFHQLTRRVSVCIHYIAGSSTKSALLWVQNNIKVALAEKRALLVLLGLSTAYDSGRPSAAAALVNAIQARNMQYCTYSGLRRTFQSTTQYPLRFQVWGSSTDLWGVPRFSAWYSFICQLHFPHNCATPL